jgi:hypothetical protein
MSKVKKIISEEVDKIVNKIPAGELVNVLKENIKIIDSLEKTFNSSFNKENQITPENWQYFIDSLTTLAADPEFQKRSKEVNCKLYAVKHYTQVKLSIAENAEDTLKFELKKYFQQLLTNNTEEFKKTFFSLPFEFVSLVVRYMSNVLLKDQKKSLTPKLETATMYLRSLDALRNEFISDINNISQGKSNVVSIINMQTLLDVKTFYEYNAINVGILEYIMRMLINPKSKQKLEDEFGKNKVELLRQQTLLHPSYVQFLQEIKDGITQTFFLKSGLQNPDRDGTFDDFVMEYLHPDQVIPQVETPEEENIEPSNPVAPPVATGAIQPKPSDLLKQPAGGPTPLQP